MEDSTTNKEFSTATTVPVTSYTEDSTAHAEREAVCTEVVADHIAPETVDMAPVAINAEVAIA